MTPQEKRDLILSIADMADDCAKKYRDASYEAKITQLAHILGFQSVAIREFSEELRNMASQTIEDNLKCSF